MVCTHTVTVLSLNNPVPSLFVVFDCIINTSVGLGHVCTRLIIHTGTRVPDNCYTCTLIVWFFRSVVLKYKQYYYRYSTHNQRISERAYSTIVPRIKRKLKGSNAYPSA